MTYEELVDRRDKLTKYIGILDKIHRKAQKSALYYEGTCFVDTGIMHGPWTRLEKAYLPFDDIVATDEAMRNLISTAHKDLKRLDTMVTIIDKVCDRNMPNEFEL